jgi:hypothetical protein
VSSTAEPPLRESIAWLDEAFRVAVATVAGTDPDPIDPFRGLYISDGSAGETATQLDAAALDDRFERLNEKLALDPLDLAILAACAAPDLDPRYGRLIGYLQDDVERGRPSTRLVARLLAARRVPADEVLRRLAVGARLRWMGAVRMVAAGASQPAADRGLYVDEMLVAELLGSDLSGRVPAEGPRRVLRTAPAPGRPELVARLARVLPAAGPALLACVGPDAEQILAHAAQRDLVVLDAPHLSDREAVAQARLLACLHDATVVVGGASRLEPAAVQGFRDGLREAADLCVLVDHADVRPVLGDGLAVHQVEVPPLTAGERFDAWSAHLPGAPVADVADRFALSAGQVAEGARIVELRIRERGGTEPAEDDLLATGRELSHGSMGTLATRLDHGPTWDDLVLPRQQLTVLESIAAFVRHRQQVMVEWGFGRRLGAATGLTALFAGESGTGKTLAARVIAADLGLEAYRIDLSGVVSKYIGETEKNLDLIFAAADGCNAVLIFDEADALFGRRTAVSDARDRYANLEVAYLLQRLESYDGAVILTTNLRHNIDPAFLRRLDFTVDFPLPGLDERVSLWARHLPPEAPTRDLELTRLGEVQQIAGGSIASCVRLAAFAAAADGGGITMEHLEQAIDLELRKLGRLGVDRHT